MVVAQIARPGTPVIYGSSWTTYDMKYISAIIASPETSILRIAGTQMAKFYGMPSHTTAPNSDSNFHDEQNAWEKSISNMCAICSGNDIVMNSGMFATGLTISHEQLVLDDEMNGIIRRIYRGIDVSRNSIDMDSIKSVGHRGDYIIEDLTLENLRSNEFRPAKVSNLKAYDTWMNDGGQSVVQNAGKKVREYLSRGVRNPLEAQKSAALEDIIRKFIENP
jgi:trimethylamine--corrinoid protein Co-methyltransferase